MDKMFRMSDQGIFFEHQGWNAEIDSIVFYDGMKEERIYRPEGDNIKEIVIKGLTYIANDWHRRRDMENKHKNFYVKNSCYRNSYELWLFVDNKNISRGVFKTSQKTDENNPHQIEIYEHWRVKVFDTNFEYKKYSHTIYDSVYIQAQKLKNRLEEKISSAGATINELIYLIDTGMLNIRLQDVM